MSKLPGKFVWFEVVTPDAAATRRFYSESLGWKVHEAEMGGPTPYAMFQMADGTAQSGVAQFPPQGERAYWISYVSVEDVDATVAKAEAHGGTLLVPAVDMPGVGRFAGITDPQGAVIFPFCGSNDDPAERPTTPGIFHWNELLAADAKAVVPFYEAVFGYTIEEMDTPMGPYFVVHSGGKPRGGIMTRTSDQIAPSWLPYVNVDDCDAAAARIAQQGGTVMNGPFDAPGIGRMAQCLDAHGGAIAVIDPTKA